MFYFCELSNALFLLRLCVRVVSSNRGGLGKTLFVRRLTDQLQNLVNNEMVLSPGTDTSLHVTVPLHGNSIDSSMLVDSLLPHAERGNVPLSRVFHLDVSPSVRHGNQSLTLALIDSNFIAVVHIHLDSQMWAALSHIMKKDNSKARESC